VLDACDANDGLSDGIVSRYASCLAAFDPKSLSCPSGKDDANSCLSDFEISSLEMMHKSYEFPFSLANGVTSYPPFNYGGEDQRGGLVEWQTGQKPPTYPLGQIGEQGRAWEFAVGVVRYFLAGRLDVDPRRFRPEDFRTRVEHISALMDSTDPDLSRFASRGGKLILKENMSDYAQSPFAGVFTVIASRPLCRYPAWPRYKGNGSPNDSSSFACAKDQK
jgi:feruloyl esterase